MNILLVIGLAIPPVLLLGYGALRLLASGAAKVGGVDNPGVKDVD